MSREIKPGSRAHEKQLAILDSAMHEFLTHGYSAASMDRISERAGVSKATVYSHFRDKEKLYEALIESKIEVACQVDMSKLAAPGTLSLQEHIKELSEIWICPLEEPESEPFMQFMRMTIAESGRFPQLARTFVERVEKPVNIELRRYLQSCGIKKADAETIAWIIAGTYCYHVVINRMMSGGDIMPMDRDRLTAMLGAMIAAYSNK